MAIVKILSRHSPTYASLIGYILRGANKDESEIFTQNLRSNDEAGYAREFMENEAFRVQTRSDQVYLFHEIVSFHADEDSTVLTREALVDLAHEYMRLHGNTGVMLGAVHREGKRHVHLHFCASALHFRTGKSFGLSKQQLQKLKLSFQQYHKQHYPELTKSAPQHGRGGTYPTHGQWHAERREEIALTVRQCFDGANTQSDFLSLLRDVGLHYYERNGVPTGIVHEYAKFRFSRLLGERNLDSLPNKDRGEEEQALVEIRAIRQRRQERNNRECEIEDRER